ncbi:MAG TPA: ThuA domain-containing protein [Bryobacteraceae bacterium]|nr:ThuA domain-containing protein [Bryobacteraceae bacterium]
MNEINRREWMVWTGALAAAGAASGQNAAEPDWYHRPMRWAQLAFVEDDPGRYDRGFWLDYFERIHADAVCLSAGGCVAFYPTKIPLHYRSKFLGNRDTFGEMLAACRKLGLNVIARIDPHAAHQDVYDAHPDWIAVQDDGKPRRHWAMPELWVTCALGPYNFEFMTGVIREIVSTYKVDGIFANRWSGSGMCYCRHCRENFKAFSGMDLPAPAGAPPEVADRFAAWHKQRLFELYSLWDGEIRKINPRAAFFPNGFDAIRDRASVPILFADRQARYGTTPPWQNGKNAKDARSTFGSKPVVGLFSVGLEAPYRWKDSVQSAAEIRAWAVDGIAQGFRPWVIKFNAKPRDHRWFKPVEDLYVWHWKNEKYLRNVRPLARVALVSGPRAAQDHASGFYQALVEARIPFETLVDYHFDPDHLRPFQVLALANAVNLSDAQCAQLQAFVERGGGIVATHETSLCDERGARRRDFGLAPLFGASFAGNVIERQQNAYLNIEDHTHPLLAGLEDAGRIIHGVKRVEITTPAGLREPLMTVPTYPDLPMEEVYVRDTTTNIPGVLVRPAGAGRVVYFPWDIDRTLWEVLNQDHAILLANAVRWAANEEQPLSVKGPGVIDVSLWRQESSITAHLVNLSNPMMMRGAFREILPVGPQQVRIKMPEAAKARALRFLVSEATPKWRQSGGWVETITPPIALHEVIAIDI